MEKFRSNLGRLSGQAKRQKALEWIEHVEKTTNNRLLLIDMWLATEEIEKAWEAYTRFRQSVHVQNPQVLKLFNAMKTHDPARLIPHYRKLVIDCIAGKDRYHYQQAIRWMKDLMQVCELAGKQSEWTGFFGDLMQEYRRYRSLMEEIRLAGLS